MSLDNVIGQTAAVRQLKVALQAYKNSGSKALGHLLLSGPPGTGKTTIADVIAKEIGKPLTVDLAQNLPTPAAAMGVLLTLGKGHILFLDEIHELPPNVSVVFYRALEERKLFIGKNRVVELPEFTLIGATTHEASLPRPLRERFKLIARLNFYNTDEINRLIQQRAHRNGLLIDPGASLFLASLSRGTPRIAVRLLDASHRCALADNQSVITLETAQRMLDVESIDTLGLDQIEVQYLRILAGTNEPIRLNVIVSQMGIPRQSIEMLEQDLTRLGLIEKNEKGRLLTAKGIDHLSVAN